MYFRIEFFDGFDVFTHTITFFNRMSYVWYNVFSAQNMQKRFMRKGYIMEHSIQILLLPAAGGGLYDLVVTIDHQFVGLVLRGLDRQSAEQVLRALSHLPA